jgi:hypothetical protein
MPRSNNKRRVKFSVEDRVLFREVSGVVAVLAAFVLVSFLLDECDCD